MGSQYGIASAMQDVVSGYEKEESRIAASDQAAKESELGDLKLEEMRGIMKREGTADAIRMMLSGDTEGAMAKYNETGEDRMSNLEFDPESGVAFWDDAEGNQQQATISHLMVSAGMDPKKLDTPEAEMGREKELIEHKAKTAKKYGIGAGASKVPADIQRHKYWMKTLTGGDPQKAFKLMQLSKSDPQAAYARILLGLQKQNQEAFGKDKMTEVQLRKAAKDSVVNFREGMFNDLFSKQKPTSPSQPAPVEGEAEAGFDPNNPSALWR